MEKEITIDNLKIHYRIAGKGQSLLILHGWGGSSHTWIKVQDILSKKDLKVIVPDLPGFGQSDFPPKPWSVDDYVNFVKKFCDELNLKNFNLLGHSFGGRISIKFSIKYKDQINNLILVDSAGIKQKLNKQDETLFALSKLAHSLSKIKIVNPLVGQIRKLLYKTILRKKDYAKLTGMMKETFRNVIYEDLLPYLNSIRVRTLIIWGAKDKIVPVRSAYIFKDRILNSQLKIIPNSGHSPNIYFPEELSDLIINFIISND